MSAGQITPGMTLLLDKKLYRVESSVKVKVKGTPFVKTKLRDLVTDDIIEKNFKSGQEVNEVSVAERTLEFLYLEGKNYLFLDVDSLDMIQVVSDAIGQRVNYLKEGTQVAATLYGETVFSVELPPFLELMVSQTEETDDGNVPVSNVTKGAMLETGAEVQVPAFIEVGDIIKVDTRTGEFIQRV